MTEPPRQTCFVDMPFGTKLDHKSGVTIDFDDVYDRGIRPAIEAAGLLAVRGDQESTGGIIHRAMFVRLLLAEFVVADMTSANPNVFYELGIRHAARPHSTIPLFATLGAPPFDVAMVRAIPYDLHEGRLTEASAAALQAALRTRIERVFDGPTADDSPLFQLLAGFRGVEMSHEVTDAFMAEMGRAEGLAQELLAAQRMTPQDTALAAVRAIMARFADPTRLDRDILMQALLAYRDLEAWDDMVRHYEHALPPSLRENTVARQQLALALNRRNEPGDRARARDIITALIDAEGESAESLGILGRIHKDLFRTAADAGDPAAPAHLDDAIAAYRRGFEVEPVDYYPGVNAITLLLVKGDEAAMAEVDRLLPVVLFAAMRVGGERASDYWTVASVLELSVIAGDMDKAERCLPYALARGDKSWMVESTAGNLRLIAERCPDRAGPPLDALISALDERAATLRGSAA